VIGLVVMIVALYYFLADGDSLLAEAKRLIPMEEADEDELLAQFEQVCRGVVMGTVVAALIQGAVASIGFAIIGIEKIWLLAVFTMFSSFIPFLGAAAVWVAVTIGLFVEQRYGAAIFLAIYGTIVISGSDNLIRAYIIHDRAQMHPLVALVTVLGALQLVGLWGIFIGPISAAFFYALLNILRRRLLEASNEKQSNPAPDSPT
jgi:predicted PurR-regulated permease PerM